MGDLTTNNDENHLNLRQAQNIVCLDKDKLELHCLRRFCSQNIAVNQLPRWE
jgi:hypothetical protein